MTAALVAAVRAQPTVLAPLDQLGRGRGVVDDDEHAAPEHERARLEPLATPVGTGNRARRARSTAAT